MRGSASSTLIVKHWAVGFLDLLGQRDALRRMDFLPDEEDEEKVAELINAVRESVGVIQGFFGLYDKFSRGAEQSTRTDPFQDLPEEAKHRIPEEALQFAREWRNTQLRHARFSDGLMVYLSLERSPEHSPVRALYELVCASGSLMLMSLAWGHPIRGGLDVGTGIEVEAGQLHGPAVVKAYELESRWAEYPRIVVGKTLTDYLKWKAEQTGDFRVQLDAQVPVGLREMLWQDGDGQPIVDYMGASFRDKVSFQVDRDMVHKAQQFAFDCRERFKESGDEKLFSRYDRLVTYFERRVHLWI